MVFFSTLDRILFFKSGFFLISLLNQNLYLLSLTNSSEIVDLLSLESIISILVFKSDKETDGDFKTSETANPFNFSGRERE